MPTDEWFKENPKISAYISPNLNEKLSEWMKNRGIKKVSQALTTILESYLGVNQDSPIAQTDKDDRLETLEQEFKSLSQTVQELRELIQASSPRLIQTELFSVEPLEKTLSDDEITLIDTEQPIETIEEIQNDEPDEILYDFQDPIETMNTTMTIKEVSTLMGWTDNKVRSRHRKNQEIEDKGRKLIPIRQENKPFWKVEKVEVEHLDF